MGKCFAQALLREGCVVHAAAPNVEGMRELEEQGATLHSLDITREADINALA